MLSFLAFTECTLSSKEGTTLSILSFRMFVRHEFVLKHDHPGRYLTFIGVKIFKVYTRLTSEIIEE